MAVEDREVPELSVLVYGATKQDAIQRTEPVVREIVPDRIARPARFGRVEAHRMGARSPGRLPQNHKKERVGGLPFPVPQLERSWPFEALEKL